MIKTLTVRLYDTLGCTVVGTALLQSLQGYLGDSILQVYTANPELLQGLDHKIKVHNSQQETLARYDVDLSNYLEIRKPQENQPLRHLYIHMLEMAEEQLGVHDVLPRTFLPKINCSNNEFEHAQKVVQELSPTKPLIWLQTKTRLKAKDWKSEYWEEVQQVLSPEYSFVDLSQQQYPPRIAVAITRFCKAGIVLDSFLLHGSKAVDAPNTIVLLISSHPEVVTYEGQYILNGLETSITPTMVIQELRSIL